jgi:hypothetical protein
MLMGIEILLIRQTDAPEVQFLSGTPALVKAGTIDRILVTWLDSFLI